MTEAHVGQFVVEHCSTPDLRDEERRLRYGVFVGEYGYLSASCYPDGREADAFDSASCSFLVRDTGTGQPAACARIILAGRVRGALLPVQMETRQEEGVEPPNYGALPAASWGEISRVTVARGYRSHRVTGDTATGLLMAATIALGEHMDLSHMFSLSEPAMARLSRPAGITMRRVGAVVEYHGRRAPYLIETAHAAAGVESRNPALFALLRVWAGGGVRRLPFAA